ncbi:hypothetical protein NDU88_000323 [Pleurodeles waltl]|uniref:Secreted protein n=1 Tax=Pleurodeles waltl TaxID=8319 RepID=A0AAV7L896_PLEWA|nr:hypothetical protein NDU88_000323 [Pleurodeles waltl]
MAWACLCWRDGGGLVISSLSLTADEAGFSGCRVFGGLPVVGQNDRGGLPRPRRSFRSFGSAPLPLPGGFHSGRSLPDSPGPPLLRLSPPAGTT